MAVALEAVTAVADLAEAVEAPEAALAAEAEALAEAELAAGGRVARLKFCVKFYDLLNLTLLLCKFDLKPRVGS